MNLLDWLRSRPGAKWLLAGVLLAVGCGIYIAAELAGKTVKPPGRKLPPGWEDLPDGTYGGGPRAREAAGY